ncbi:MAG TPA: phenylalanine--tRNA ligase subunit beta [Gemmatimonadales bacterium]|nr:phenylalanine--tRNA ligase subunit beta [Gemmatimonadales bacterium]
MNISRRWLEDFLRRPLEAQDVAERLAMLGAPVDAIEPVHAGLSEIVVALVEAVGPHPDADRLRLCLVNDGSPEKKHVVCGAPNVTAGHRYPFIRVGSTLPGGLKIEKRKIRGQVSEGMLCSARELELGQEHGGILELTVDAAPGTPLLDVLPLADDRFVVDVTPNRPDLLGHKGVARELAASLGVAFRLPELPGADSMGPPPSRRAAEPSISGNVRVSIEDPDGCARFHGAVIRGVKIGPSPEWLRRRLEAVGARSINNVVDATNYVMLEHAQPTHAYDLHKLRGPAVIARRARDGERLTTLDGVDRALDSSMTIIADAEGPIGIGGVMGGAASEVDDGTTDVFLECAWFQPARVRRTRRTLGLSTDASYRFERGVDLWAAPEAFQRLMTLVLAVAGGTVDGEPVDLWPRVSHPPRIFLRLDRVAQVLGQPLDQRTVEQHLVAIGATCVAKPEERRIAVDVPGWRPDLVEEIDLIEEVARMHGYGAFPADLRAFRTGAKADAPEIAIMARVRRAMADQGLHEVITLPLVAPDPTNGVTLLNPLSAEESRLRGAILPSLRRQAERNWAAQMRDIRLFEVGTVFAPGAQSGRPTERMHLAAVISGGREPGHWSGAAPDVDRWDLKGLFEAAVHAAHPNATVTPGEDGWEATDARGERCGWAHPLEADAPPWAAPLLGLELVVDTVAARPRPAFVPLPATPASDRDVTLLVPDGVTSAAIVSAFAQSGVAMLESVTIVNEYRGPRVAAGARSVTARLRFRAPDRTLESAEVDRAEARLLTALERATGVRRREQ